MVEEFEFAGQRSDEKVVLVKRKHPWVLAKPGFVVILVITFLLVLLLGIDNNLVRTVAVVGSLIFILWYSAAKWFVYNQDVVVLTNQRIVNITQKGIFHRRVAETELDCIYNVAYEVKGIMANILNYGDVQISTVGDELSTMILSDLDNPRLVQEKVVAVQRKYKKQSGLIE